MPDVIFQIFHMPCHAIAPFITKVDFGGDFDVGGRTAQVRAASQTAQVRAASHRCPHSSKLKVTKPFPDVS